MYIKQQKYSIIKRNLKAGRWHTPLSQALEAEPGRSLRIPAWSTWQALPQKIHTNK